MFELFDPCDEVCIREGGNLPHWYQPGVTYFITFRTADSIPEKVAKLWRLRRDEWLRRHGVEPGRAEWKTTLARLPRSARREFHETFSREYLEHLDRGHGACVLKRPELAQLVAHNLRYHDARRYHLGDFVVIPNRVHLLVCLLGETEAEAQCTSWKRYTATRINRRLGRRGRFWQEESFDHLVRSPEQLEALRRYIADNPHAARLRQGEFLHWRR